MKRNLEKEIEKIQKPKVFCGNDHCSGLWNLPCDDLNHKVRWYPESLVAVDKVSKLCSSVCDDVIGEGQVTGCKQCKIEARQRKKGWFK